MAETAIRKQRWHGTNMNCKIGFNEQDTICDDKTCAM